MSSLEVRHLEALVALTEEGTFTDAALRLGVTQSAVSRTIGAAEGIVGVQLVERTTRSVALTPAGTRCYRAALEALAALGDVLAAAHDGVRPLRLGYAWSALGRHTTTVLRRWRAEHPDLPLEVHRIDEHDGGLHRGLADVSAVRGDFDEPDIITRTIFTETRMAALALGHPLAGAASVSLSQLRDEVVILATNGTTTLELWPAGARPTRTLHVDNTDEWLTEIAGGLAIGVTAASTATQHAHPGVAFVLVHDAPAVTVRLAWPARRPHPAVLAFVDLVTLVVSDG